MFAASLLSRFMHNPSHKGVGKRILRYLQGVFSWCSKKQQTVAQSSVEAEYVATTLATLQAIWLRRIFEDIGEKQLKPTIIFCDSMSAIAIAKNPVHHSHTKHIALKHHFIREAIEDGEVQLEFCETNDQIAGIVTKALRQEKF
ncbi:retrovirus-related pol polyprotein from transposon TNT 1-94 [Tanacetum coccineum]